VNEQAYTILRVRPTGRARRAPGGSTASAVLVASEPTVESLSPSEVADARRAPDADVAPVLPMKLVRPLAVGGAFHTPLMAPAAEAFGAAVAEVDFAPLTAPVVTNHDATAHFARRGWPERLAPHLVRPVRWRETVDGLVALGARRLVELGPGTTLTALARRCRDDVEPLSAATPDEVEALLPSLWGVGR